MFGEVLQKNPPHVRETGAMWHFGCLHWVQNGRCSESRHLVFKILERVSRDVDVKSRISSTCFNTCTKWFLLAYHCHHKHCRQKTTWWIIFCILGPDNYRDKNPVNHFGSSLPLPYGHSGKTRTGPRITGLKFRNLATFVDWLVTGEYSIRKIPAPIKIKLPHLHLCPPRPPPTKTKQKKQGILWAQRFSSRKSPKIPGIHKCGAAISGPRF